MALMDHRKALDLCLTVHGCLVFFVCLHIHLELYSSISLSDSTSLLDPGISSFLSLCDSCCISRDGSDLLAVNYFMSTRLTVHPITML
jgi:hypothetical protein